MSQSLPTPKIQPYGDAAVLLSYGVEGFSDAASQAVLSLSQHFKAQSGWTDIVCGYDSIMGTFDPQVMRLGAAVNRFQLAAQSVDTLDSIAAVTVDIPVHYGSEHGPDMNAIMDASGLSEAGVIDAHAAQTYRVCMMGFVPGFTFLSPAPKALHHPRHDTPRLSVPAGSIGIAGWQTGIYGLSSPGGWQIIGRTEASIFDINRSPIFLLKAGDNLRFVPQR
ncbi:5-oxoprolinase subunit PxpB [Fretibacter rubidus]|uniref:5-oxoprolinase subunit PxpB n=1 Tax=Fretibacter rubidus TaxID=570162 RepID=UPI00352B5656